jgi:glutamate-1-semialdehyde 2,1-aminomutase
MQRTRSEQAFHHAQNLIPGGVNSPARAFGAVGGTPLFITRGEGPYIFDLDGHRYLDYIGSWGPMILGHCNPAVTAAVIEAVHQGSSFGAPTERESEMAQLVIDAVPSIEMVRFVSSGTEAAMSALRLARGYTGRARIVKFAGCYHGHVDSLLVQAGSAATTLGVPNSPGVPAGCTQDTLSLPYNDTQALVDLFQAHGDSIACVMLEPVAGNMGLIVPSAEFLKELRNLTHKHGALLVYDEVMTGFRLAYGGAQELLGQMPDVTVLGKIIGGGYPAAAYGGRADVMKKVMPAGPVFQAGTLSGNPVAMAAGIATLKELKRLNPYAELERLGRYLAEGLRRVAPGLTVNQVGSMWTLFFTPDPVTDYDSAKRSDTQKFGRFFWAMMDRGIYLPCSQFEAAFNSVLHSQERLDETIAATRDALAQLD